MTVLRMDHVGVVVRDLAGAVAFFTELGMEQEGATSVEGPWVDGVSGMKDVRADIVMMRTPDGHGKLELTAYRNPAASGNAKLPPNTVGLRNVMFEVDDVEDTAARLRTLGGELIGEITRFGDVYLLCYVCGPEGIIVALAEDLRAA